MSTKQQTLKAPISFSGKGLHTGVKVTMTVNPAEAGTGIVFRRTDLEGQPIIPALCDNVIDTSRGTTVEAGGHRVHTIEHIMSALWTLGVDNAVIDIDAPETPIMDGSAREYARAITETGLADQDAERQFYHVTEKMVYTIPEKGVAIILYPDDEFSVSVHVDYNSKVIGNQYATFNPGDDFARKISPVPHVRLPARAGAADQHEPDQGRRPGQRHRGGGKPRARRTAGQAQEGLQQARHRDQGGLPQ